MNIWIKGYANDTILIKLNSKDNKPILKLKGQLNERWYTDYYGEGKRILIFEPYKANSTGKDKRPFSFDSDMTKQLFSGNVPNDIKVDFLEILNERGLSFDQFSLKTDWLPGSYSFSPDHTGVVDSLNKHINANWVQFFIGGANTKYYPSNDPGFVIVELTNDTSRNSLLLHVGDEYRRDGTGINRSLSTITQIFRYKLKIQ